MNEMTPKLVEGKVEIIEASAPEATPTPGSTAGSGAGGGTGSSGSGQPSATPTPTATEKPSTTPKTTEQPHEDIPQSGGTGEHAPFLKGYPGGLFKPENNITRRKRQLSLPNF